MAMLTNNQMVDTKISYALSNWAIRRKWWSRMQVLAIFPQRSRGCPGSFFPSKIMTSPGGVSSLQFLGRTRQELPVHKFEVLHAEEDGCSDVWTARVGSQEFCPKPLLSTSFYNFVCFLLCIFFLPGKPWRTPQAFSTKSSGHVRCCFFASFFVPLWYDMGIYGNIWDDMVVVVPDLVISLQRCDDFWSYTES